MTGDELAFSGIAELAGAIRRRDLSSSELTAALIARTEQHEPLLNTYISFQPEEALAQARAADNEVGAGRYRGPLHGIPVSLKDIFDVSGMPTTGGARFLQNKAVATDARVTRRLRDGGAVLMGKANLNKFAGGESGDNPDFGRMRNPWNPEFSPGGSSGGSGVQVAAGMVPLSIGTDNGGSVRMPAALCGVTGLKPTFGRISMEGMFPRAYSFDHAGPLTRSVRDAAIALGVLAGHDSGDTTTFARPVPDYVEALERDARGLRVGIDRSFVTVAQPDVRHAFENAVATLGSIGMEIAEIAMPEAGEMRAVFGAIFVPEWGAAHEPWLRSHPEEYPEQWTPRAALLRPAVDYVKANRRRRLIQQQYARATAEVDVVVLPTYPLDFRPFDGYPPVEGKTISFDDALRYTTPFNLLGLPAISVPCGFSSGGFPIGLQLAGAAFDETAVLRAAHAYQSATDWHTRRPPLPDSVP